MGVTYRNNIKFFFSSVSKTVMILALSGRNKRNYLKSSATILVCISKKLILFAVLHSKMTTQLGSSLQLLDINGTQLIEKKNVLIKYLLYSLKKKHNFEIIAYNPCAGTSIHTPLPSLDNLFFNCWWLEREVSEMLGYRFYYKKDSRNLLLEYTNVFKPMLKFFPVIGFFELFFSMIAQTIIHKAPTIQT